MTTPPTPNAASTAPKMPLPCIDRITQLELGKAARASRRVEASEEYFIDHFSEYAVLPGVLQLEGMVQTAAWLVLASEDFARSQVRMTACSQAKYSQLVRPGMDIEFEANIAPAGDAQYDVKGRVTEQGKTVATARFRLESKTIGDTAPRFAHLEPLINDKNRRIFLGLTS
ncbi:MAG: hypothetical protein KBD07_03780 [Candidatus Omnitrophica bacterium]|jgi:3-hydroxyacyl-[acyl-carrier-protein] dehydratase|nr:hypothetical protein [Candidatus Omnitrophota bacterium]